MTSMRPLRRHLTFANVMSCIAVFVALATGGAYAANTVFSTDIVDGEVKSEDIADQTIRARDIETGAVNSGRLLDESVRDHDLAPESVGTSEVAPDSLTGADLDEAEIGKVPLAANADTLGFQTPAQLRAVGFPTDPMTPCDPLSEIWSTCFGSTPVDVDATGALLVIASGQVSGREAGPDAGACRFSLDEISLSYDFHWGQAANPHDSFTHGAPVTWTYLFPLVFAGEHDIYVQCQETEGDFRVDELNISVLRVGT